MEKKTDEELASILIEARKIVPRKTIYVHKKSGNYYIAIDVALQEHNLEPLVIYSKSLMPSFPANDFIIFTRPLNEFIERFEKI